MTSTRLVGAVARDKRLVGAVTSDLGLAEDRGLVGAVTRGLGLEDRVWFLDSRLNIYLMMIWICSF